MTHSSTPAQTAPTSQPAYWPWLVWAGVLLLLDQLTKQWILNIFDQGDWVPLTSFFNLVRAHNTGAAFSFLASHGGWQRWLFVGIGVVATVLIIWQLRKHPQQKFFCFAIASILGGAIGNVIDRLQHGYVVDFLDFHIGSWHYPAFNVADIAICVGAASLILDEVLRARRSKKAAALPPA